MNIMCMIAYINCFTQSKTTAEGTTKEGSYWESGKEKASYARTGKRKRSDRNEQGGKKGRDKKIDRGTTLES